MIKTPSNERGAALILVTASLLVLMGIVAIVVDGGMAFDERRQAQSAADFASLAALQEAVSCPSPCTKQASANNGAVEAMARVEGNLPGRYGAADWTACSDPARPPRFDPANGGVVAKTAGGADIGCISFTNNFDESRVVLPDDEISTSFGRVIGFNTLTVGAFAEAGQDLDIRVSAIPFTPIGLSPGGGEACLLSASQPMTVDPCSGSASGFSGYLDIALYGDDEIGTPSICTAANNDRIVVNIAKGSDHNMVPYEFGPPADTIINDHAACPNTSEDVNQLFVRTGSSDIPVSNGLFVGTGNSINGQPMTPSEGRLECDPADPATVCANVRGRDIDHTGLWEYLDSGCSPTPSTHEEMRDCLETGSPTFKGDILGAPRFAAIPIFHNDPDAPGAYRIKEFIPVWLETTYYNCNSGPAHCDTVHSPGETFPGTPPGVPPACPAELADDTKNCDWSDTSGPDSVYGLTALVLKTSMLPADIQENFPGVPGTRTYALIK